MINYTLQHLVNWSIQCTLCNKWYHGPDIYIGIEEHDNMHVIKKICLSTNTVVSN